MRYLAVTVLLFTSAWWPAGAEAQGRGDATGMSRQIGTGGGTLASFEGRTINLAEDWEEARACLVWRQEGVLECFASAEALDAREAQLSRRRGATAPSVSASLVPTSGAPTAAVAAYAYSCSSSLRLYDDNWYGGRRLSFWDRGFWQNLGDYGFNDRASSYIVGGCFAYLAEHADGGGWWYPGPTYPYAGEPVMYSDWQDTISSVYVG